MIDMDKEREAFFAKYGGGKAVMAALFCRMRNAKTMEEMEDIAMDTLAFVCVDKNWNVGEIGQASRELDDLTTNYAREQVLLEAQPGGSA